MSRLFGELRQIGIVVRDIEAAMAHWVEVCGIGPWFYADKLPVTAFSYRGARHDDIHLSVALANSGEVQLELIQQRCDSPSMYQDFLRAGREGMQHWSSWPADYDARLDQAPGDQALLPECVPAVAVSQGVLLLGQVKDVLAFTQDQSCGKCTFCRIGTKRMLEILDRIVSGKGSMKDIDSLENISTVIMGKTICPLADAAAMSSALSSTGPS